MMAAAVKPPCAALAALAALAAAPAARAQPAGSLWSGVTTPGAHEALTARRSGEWINLLDELPEPRRARLAPERADIDHESLRAEALAHLERALALRPDDPRALASAARLRERRNDLDGALRDATRSLALDPEGPAAQDAHFTLAVVHTWRGEHPAARDHYLALLRLPVTEHTRSMVLGNLGDEFQALGDMDAAIDSYVACVALRPGYALGWLGLAIARDRAHLDPAPDAATAVRAASDDVLARMQALRMGPGFDPAALLDVLSSEGVFYVPAYDRFYYQGVAHEAAARAWSAGNDFGVAPVAAEADAHRRAARVAWRRYLDAAAPDDPWRGRAEAHLRALGPSPR